VTISILRRAIIFLVALIVLSSCTALSEAAPEPYPESVWIPTNSSSQRGVAVIVPGLNVCPHGMRELAAWFNEQGFDVLTVPLVGQSSKEDNQIELSTDLWIGQIAATYSRARSQAKDGMVVAVGYSLGAALLVDLLNNSPEIHFDRIVMLAPAVSLTCISTLARLLLPLRHLGVSLPSMSPERLRCSGWTTLQSYSALFEAVDRADGVTNQSTLRTTPLLIAMSRDDELVSFQGVERWKLANKLTRANLIALLPVAQSSDSFAHTIIDSQGLGVAEWRELMGAMERFLAE